jgi:hypothetical protein
VLYDEMGRMVYDIVVVEEEEIESYVGKSMIHHMDLVNLQVGVHQVHHLIHLEFRYLRPSPNLLVDLHHHSRIHHFLRLLQQHHDLQDDKVK